MAQSNAQQKKAFQEGRKAAETGKDRTANPYVSKTLLRDKWAAGWETVKGKTPEGAS